MNGSDSDDLIQESYERNAPSVDVDMGWEMFQTRMAGEKHREEIRDGGPRTVSVSTADDHKGSRAPRASAPKRRSGRRIVVLASVAVVLVAAVAIGSLEALKHLGHDHPILVITDETPVGPTGATAPIGAESLGAWERLPLTVEGGAIQVLVIDPTDPAVLYAGTAQGLFKSTDGAESWMQSAPGWIDVRMIAVDPGSPADVYMSAVYDTGDGLPAGLYRSQDAGATWSEVPEMSGLFTRLWFDTSSSPSTLYASTAFIAGFFRSDDGGETWTRLKPAGRESEELVQLAVDASRHMLYAVCQGSAETFLRSADKGATWEDITSYVPLAFQTAPGAVLGFTLRVDPTDTSRLYLGTVSQALTSVDGGLTWFAPSGSALDRAKAVLNTDPGTPGAAVDGASAFFSEGFEGTTFATKLLDAFREASVTGVHGPVVIDSANPSNLYLPTDQGVFKSTDQGQTWRKASAGLLDLSVSSVLVDPSSPSTLVALASSGVMTSTDGGGTWLNVLPAPVLSVVMAPSSPSTLYASTASGLLVSDDSGADWSTLTTTGLPDTSVSIELVLVASDDAKTIYADVSGTEPAADGFYRSTDGGTTWSRVLDNVTAAARVVVESPGDPSILFADMFQNGLYRSDDHGGTWGQISPLAFTGFAIDPHDPSVMHGAVEGVQGKTTCLSSTDGGGTWREMQASGLPDRVEWLLCDPNTSSVYYAVVWTEPDPGPLGTVVYRSVDGGRDWQYMSDGLPMSYPNLAVDRVPGGGLYAATDQGLYKWLPTAK